MSAAAASRIQILDRIRNATQGSALAPYAELPRAYIRTGSLDAAAITSH